ncbi:MAG: AAA family ATPase [Deltaproteobacteria bacterium]|jgi:hypothetical protein|nr:AAA family ATPase [Deltaproteobacteria bacterium]
MKDAPLESPDATESGEETTAQESVEESVEEAPVRLTDFADLRRNGHFYADKTEFLFRLVKQDRPIFLARPPRFGKSLLLSSFERLLEGQRDLFKGLWIDQADYDWAPSPVIKLDINQVTDDTSWTLENNLSQLTQDEAKRLGIQLKMKNPANTLSSLILNLFDKYDKKVSILIDGYDAPIIKHLDQPNDATNIREILKKFYDRLRSDEEMIGPIFITGVCRFDWNSIFSYLPNLYDLTFERDYAAICGFTAVDIEDLLGDRKKKILKRLLKEKFIAPGSQGKDLSDFIRDFYGGYSWDGRTRVYNPWSALSFLHEGKLSNYWYSCGIPNLLREMRPEALGNLDWFKNLPSLNETNSYIDNLNRLDLAVLLFQTGFLTIKEKIGQTEEIPEYSLGLPNIEVQAALAPVVSEISQRDNPIKDDKESMNVISDFLKLKDLMV